MMSQEEQERRRHIRQWARFMISHLAECEPDETRHYTYLQALERLRDLVQTEITAVKGSSSAEGPLERATA